MAQKIDTPTSSACSAYQYNEKDELLAVWWRGIHSSQPYVYKDVPANVIAAMGRAPSVGKFLQEFVRDVYYVVKKP